MNYNRLLMVARALRESECPGFTMGLFGHSCGTPACAMGHYAARRDLQQLFSLRPRDKDDYCSIGAALFVEGNREQIGYRDDSIVEHFDISKTEAETLFSTHGCGNAQTAIEAAEYIETFVERHRAGELVGSAEPVDPGMITA